MVQLINPSRYSPLSRANTSLRRYLTRLPTFIGIKYFSFSQRHNVETVTSSLLAASCLVISLSPSAVLRFSSSWNPHSVKASRSVLTSVSMSNSLVWFDSSFSNIAHEYYCDCKDTTFSCLFVEVSLLQYLPNFTCLQSSKTKKIPPPIGFRRIFCTFVS